MTVPATLYEKYSMERIALYNLLEKLDDAILSLASGNVASYSLGNRSVSYTDLDKIFYPNSNDQKPNLQKLLTLLNDCTEQEANDLLPMVRYLLELLRKQDNPTY